MAPDVVAVADVDYRCIRRQALASGKFGREGFAGDVLKVCERYGGHGGVEARRRECGRVCVEDAGSRQLWCGRWDGEEDSLYGSSVGYLEEEGSRESRVHELEELGYSW